MLLTITTTHVPATDLGYLLHKHPDRVHTFSLNFGTATVLFPEVGVERCTAALIADLDPVALVRERRGPTGDDHALAQYVNDRPYAASSFLSVAIAQVFGTALGGRSKDRPDLAATAIPLAAHLPCVPCRGGEAVLRRVFEPLGYVITATNAPIDECFPGWGPSRYWTLDLAATIRLVDLLNHLYVLIPVLDDEKHYWVDEAEIAKLLRHGEGWLAGHPERALIVERSLRHCRRLTRAALARLADEDDPDAVEAERAAEEEQVERGINLNQQRQEAVLAVLRECGCRRVVDLGCGEGRLLARLLDDRSMAEVVGLDVSVRALDLAAERLRLDRMPAARRERLKLLHGSLIYHDCRLEGYDAAVAAEVIEHFEPYRLDAFTRNLFGCIRATTIVITTPNREHNVRFAALPAGRLRHGDHRFEWTRQEFRAWAGAAAAAYDYAVAYQSVGPDDPEVGPPSQLAVFRRGEGPVES